MCSSHQSHPWLRLCSRKRSSCCSIVCVCAWRWVETRTYMATFISALLGERSCWLLLRDHCTPLDKRLVAPVPSVLSVGPLNAVTEHRPLPFLHVYPPEDNVPCCFPQKDILPLDEHSKAVATRRAAIVLSGSYRICHFTIDLRIEGAIVAYNNIARGSRGLLCLLKRIGMSDRKTEIVQALECGTMRSRDKSDAGPI